MRWRGVSIGIATALAAVGCGTAMRDRSVQIVPRRIIAAPTVGAVWEWDFNGKMTIFEEPSVAAMKNLDDSINYRLGQHGGHAFSRPAFEALKWAQPFGEWSRRMMGEIRKERMADYRYGRALADWRERLGADFILVSKFSDGRNTAGRTVAITMGGGYLAAKGATACLVQLLDGRVVWCKRTDFIGKLDQRPVAQAVADKLLSDLLGDLDKVAPAAPAPAAAPQPGDTR